VQVILESIVPPPSNPADVNFFRLSFPAVAGIIFSDLAGTPELAGEIPET